jgi:hypothetical protein
MSRCSVTACACFSRAAIAPCLGTLALACCCARGRPGFRPTRRDNLMLEMPAPPAQPGPQTTLGRQPSSQRWCRSSVDASLHLHPVTVPRRHAHPHQTHCLRLYPRGRHPFQPLSSFPRRGGSHGEGEANMHYLLYHKNKIEKIKM